MGVPLRHKAVISCLMPVAIILLKCKNLVLLIQHIFYSGSLVMCTLGWGDANTKCLDVCVGGLKIDIILRDTFVCIN